VLAKGLHDLQVLPRPEGMSEMYFTDYRKSTASFHPGDKQKVKFTVHNLEHQATTYRYHIVTKSSDGAPHIEAEGVFTLADGASRITSKVITIPGLVGRTAVEVGLDYIGTAPGSTVEASQKQSIHYWIDVADPRPSERRQQ